MSRFPQDSFDTYVPLFIPEFQEFKMYMSKFSIFKYSATEEVKLQIKDGGVAIIDQIICSHAR